MALRTRLGCVAALVVCALTACKNSNDSNEDAGGKTAPTAAPVTAEQLNKRCEQLGKTCGDKEKHEDKIADECKQVAKKQLEKGCADKAVAAYDCYEKEICGRLDKVWVMDDFRVLSDRNGKCAAERHASDECAGKH